MKQVCVYGASSDEINPSFKEAAEKLGQLLAQRQYGLVFGGGAHGLMGAVARGISAGGGQILGIAPTFFHVDGILYKDCTEFIYTKTMRERKQLMEDRSDAFVVTPGGMGTWEEFFEVLTLKQLGRHNKPIAILNTNGYYDTMLTMLSDAADQGFMKPNCLLLYRVCSCPEEVLEYFERYDPAALNVKHLKNI